MALNVDLFLTLKETQLHHGLRTENFARYHKYLSGRVATLRRQLKLSNEKKKFLNKDLARSKVADSRYLLLLALYAERCWAEAEEMLELRASMSQGSGKKPGGGTPPSEQFRKRFNKAVVWATRLREVGEAVGNERTKIECEAYYHEVAGRCAVSHARYTEAKRSFTNARGLLFSLRLQCSEAQWPVILNKVGEMDDRVVFCMQCLGEDAASYHPDLGDAATASHFATTVEWNGRKLNVINVKVKDALREATQLDASAVLSRSLEAASLVPAGTQIRVLEAMDRTIGLYNDALQHTRQDLRSASESRKTELQLLVHYISYQIAWHALQRSRFMIEVFQRRYCATVRHGKIVDPQRAPSPFEAVHLYATALETIEEMKLLPGVLDREDVTHWELECRAGKLFFVGQSWLVCEEYATAATAFNSSLALLRSVATPAARELEKWVRQSRMELMALISLKDCPTDALETTRYLAESLDEYVPATNITRFPPDYQAVPCKPVFVDIASTFIDFPRAKGTPSPSPSEAPTSKEEARGHDAKRDAAEQRKGWGWKSWGWGKK
jgi:signal recognition particle subunit SRP68